MEQVVEVLGKILEVLEEIRDIALDFDSAYLEEDADEESDCEEEDCEGEQG